MKLSFCNASFYTVLFGLFFSLAGCSQQQLKEFIDPSGPFEVEEEWQGWWSQSQSDVMTFGGDSRILGAYLVDTKARLCFFIAGGGATEISCAKLANRPEWREIIDWEKAEQ